MKKNISMKHTVDEERASENKVSIRTTISTLLKAVPSVPNGWGDLAPLARSAVLGGLTP